jgi:hypothetical protein
MLSSVRTKPSSKKVTQQIMVFCEFGGPPESMGFRRHGVLSDLVYSTSPVLMLVCPYHSSGPVVCQVMIPTCHP